MPPSSAPPLLEHHSTLAKFWGPTENAPGHRARLEDLRGQEPDFVRGSRQRATSRPTAPPTPRARLRGRDDLGRPSQSTWPSSGGIPRRTLTVAGQFTDSRFLPGCANRRDLWQVVPSHHAPLAVVRGRLSQHCHRTVTGLAYHKQAMNDLIPVSGSASGHRERGLRTTLRGRMACGVAAHWLTVSALSASSASLVAWTGSEDSEWRWGSAVKVS